MDIKEIARQTNISHETIREFLEKNNKKEYYKTTGYLRKTLKLFNNPFVGIQLDKRFKNIKFKFKILGSKTKTFKTLEEALIYKNIVLSKELKDKDFLLQKWINLYLNIKDEDKKYFIKSKE